MTMINIKSELDERDRKIGQVLAERDFKIREQIEKTV